MSRDISGYVGPKYRNKSISDLLKFKQNIVNNVKNTLKEIKLDPTTSKNWKLFTKQVIKRLSKN